MGIFTWGCEYYLSQGAMMLDHLGCPRAARDMEASIAKVLVEGKVRTPDLGGTSTTQEVGEAIAEYTMIFSGQL